MSLLSTLLIAACTVAFTTVALSVAFRIGLAQSNRAQNVRERLDQAGQQIQERWEHLLGRMEALVERVEQQRKD
jgi:hypothetical protein